MKINQSMKEALKTNAMLSLRPRNFSWFVSDIDSEGFHTSRKQRRVEADKQRDSGWKGTNVGHSEAIAKARHLVKIQKRSRVISRRAL